MSIKKELLGQMSLQQLKDLAESKGITLSMNDTQKKYYEEWSERDRMIDLMNDNHDITVREIEELIKSKKA